MSSVDDLGRFATAVYGGCSGFVEVAWFTRGKMKSSHIPVSEFVEDPTPLLELAEQGLDVYLGCVTLSEKPATGRGKSVLRTDSPGVWLDLDIDAPGHHKPREDGLRHLLDLEEGAKLLREVGLPEPTAVVSSGGGAYAWWLFPEPLTLQVDETDRSAALSLSEAVNARVSSFAAQQGIGIDRVGDMSRILRPPGSVNWKRGVSDPQPVRLLYLDEELRVSPDEIAECVEEVSLGRRFSAGTAQDSSTDSWDSEESSGSLADAVKAASWEEILFPLGWTYGAPVSGATSFLRPGHAGSAGAKPGDGYGSSSSVDDGAKSAGVYADGPHNLVVWSDACGLPQGTGHKLTKFRVMAHLYFGGSESACARDLSDAVKRYALDLSGASRVPWPESVLRKGAEVLDNAFTRERLRRVRTWQSQS